MNYNLSCIRFLEISMNAWSALATVTAGLRIPNVHETEHIKESNVVKLQVYHQAIILDSSSKSKSM